MMWPTTEAVSTWRSLSPSSWLCSCVPFHSLLSTCGHGFGASRLFVCVCVWIRHNNLSPICLGSMAIFMLRDFYVSWRISRYAFDLVLCNIMRFLACCLCPQLGHSLTIYHLLKMLSPTILLWTPSFGTEIRGIDTARIVIFLGRLCFYTQFDALRRIR